MSQLRDISRSVETCLRKTIKAVEHFEHLDRQVLAGIEQSLRGDAQTRELAGLIAQARKEIAAARAQAVETSRIGQLWLATHGSTQGHSGGDGRGLGQRGVAAGPEYEREDQWALAWAIVKKEWPTLARKMAAGAVGGVAGELAAGAVEAAGLSMPFDELLGDQANEQLTEKAADTAAEKGLEELAEHELDESGVRSRRERRPEWAPKAPLRDRVLAGPKEKVRILKEGSWDQRFSEVLLPGAMTYVAGAVGMAVAGPAGAIVAKSGAKGIMWVAQRVADEEEKRRKHDHRRR